MNSFKVYFKKEVMESIRQHRYLILGVGFIFWAILNPLTLKLLPHFMKGSVPDVLITEMSKISRVEAIQNYMQDVFSIGNLFVIFSLMGIIAEEVGSERLVLPMTKGVEQTGIVLAKTIHYFFVVAIFVALGFLINYGYVNMIFEGEIIEIAELVKSISLYAIYYLFIISLIIFFSSIFNKSIVTGISVLLISFGLASLQSIPALKEYLPNYLLSRAGQFGGVYDSSLITVIGLTLLISILLNVMAIFRLKYVEIV